MADVLSPPARDMSALSGLNRVTQNIATDGCGMRPCGLNPNLRQTHGLQRAAAGDKGVSLAIVFELHADRGTA